MPYCPTCKVPVESMERDGRSLVWQLQPCGHFARITLHRLGELWEPAKEDEA